MMKGKIKYLLIIAICLFSLNTKEVFAGNANVGIYCIEQHPEMINDPGAVYCSPDNLHLNKTRPGFEDCGITYTENGKTVCHKNYNISVNVDGGQYEGYCADQGVALHDVTYMAADAFTCEEVSGSFGSNVASILSNPSLSRNQKTKALRDYTWNGVAPSTQNGSFSLSNPVENGNVVVFSINSNGIDLNQVTFTCSNGCTVQRSGNTLTATVSPQKGLCSFTITATYSGSGGNFGGNFGGAGSSGASGGSTSTGGTVLRCHAKNQQDVYILKGGTPGTNSGNSSNPSSGNTNSNTNSNANSNGGTYTYSYSFKEGGSYYNEYCTDEPKPNTCECNQKTTVNMPGLCDTGTNTGSINAPTDVKCCILNNQDEAGNTYEMLDNQITTGNPYCSVFCKEDYEMTLPGAKYTTSGRYFELENSIVSAKRTCYATSGTSRESAEEYNIGIDQFVRDVKAQQEALKNAFNAYQIAKARYDSVSDIESEDTDEVKCSRNVCNGPLDENGNCHFGFSSCENTYTNDKKTGRMKPYKEATLTMKNEKEGSYTVTVSDGELQDYLGGTWSCNGCVGSYTQAGTYKTIGEYAQAMEAARLALNEARETLKKTIEYMEECYNWINDLCMDPIVNFDYDEQYNSSINYTKVSGGGSFPSSNATYSTSKEIDNAYTANSGGTLETIDYAYCTESDCQNGGEGTATNISTLVSQLYYRKIEANGSAEYANTQQFQTNYPHGTIDTVSNPGALRPNYSYLGAVFPVALNTPTGVYKWTLNFSNLGKYNDYVGCGLGRLDTVVAALGESSSAGLEYVCVYVVDCDDCDYDCVGEGCLIPDEPKCPECDVYCTNCIFDGDGNTFYFQVETANDTNPSGRARGANWSNEKAEVTKNEIESNGESVYVNAQYVYRLTPENMAAIRKYNAETQTYVREDLNYHTIGNVTNAYGTSKVLDEGERKGYFTEIKRTTDRTLWTGATGNGMGPAWKVGN